MRQVGSKLWLVCIYAFLYLPLCFMVVYSFNSLRSDAVFGEFSWRWYEALMRETRLIEGFWLSLKVALITGVLSTVLGTAAAFSLVRYRRFIGRTLLAGMSSAPMVVPEVILGLSVLLLFKGAFNLIGWPDNGVFTIVVGHTLLGMAYGMVVIQARLQEMDGRVEEAAMDLGARPFQVFFLVTLPNMVQALAASFLLAFTLSFDDVVISEFLSGPGFSTLPQVIFGYARRGINPTIYAAATLLIVAVTLTVVIYSFYVYHSTRRRKQEMQAALRT